MKLTVVASMHFFNVDTSEAVPRGWKDNHPEMHHCMPVEFGGELGQ